MQVAVLSQKQGLRWGLPLALCCAPFFEFAASLKWVWGMTTVLPTLSCDVAIVGAGPAGLMAAQRLAEQGRQVLVLDGKATAGRKFLPILSPGMAVPVPGLRRCCKTLGRALCGLGHRIWALPLLLAALAGCFLPI